ncbi:MAG TPA: 2Fe-2S iron-sulfur cluster-binding protein [Gemmataceae bacterium]|jgi:xanthine dehydrogenase YagT iron-sulfur-binding subunit
MNDSQGKSRGGISRRAFLTGSGTAAAAGLLPPVIDRGLNEAVAADDSRSAAGKPVAVGPGPVQIELTVNGKKLSTKVEPRVTLLDALRNDLDVTGSKRVCDRGTCGACTVMIDGRAIYSCTMLAVEARGKQVKTAESLVNGSELDAVPAAFAKCDAQQCGFCTPGFVVAMRAALDKNPNATPAEVEDGVSGNICRCGTYEQMRHAIELLCRKGG